MATAQRSRAAVVPARRPTPAVFATVLDGALLELYDYEPGPPSDIERHVHGTYQIGLALDMAGEYSYRGSTEPVPTRRLVIIHPGEPHAVRDTDWRPVRARYLMMYLEPALFGEPGLPAEPFFPAPLEDARLIRSFLDVFRSAGVGHDVDASIAALADGLSQAAGTAPEIAAPPAALLRVRDLLHDAPLLDAPLSELAAVAGLHPHHLVRSFTAHFGVPPHRYRRLLRIDLAKRGLTRGEPISKVALDSGFYDQSHFGHHFRRIVGTTPGRYRGS